MTFLYIEILAAVLFLWWQIRSTRPADGGPRQTKESFLAELEKEKAEFIRTTMLDVRSLARQVTRETAKEIEWEMRRPKWSNNVIQTDIMRGPKS